MKKEILITLIFIALIFPVQILAQDGSVPEARVMDVPMPSADAGVSATSAPVAVPVATSVVTPHPALTTVAPIPTSRPSPASEQEFKSQNLAGEESSSLPEDWFYKYALTLLGVGGGALLSYGVLKFKKSRNNKNEKDSDRKCGSIRELLEQRKKELEAMIKNWPQDKLKQIAEEKVTEQLEKNEETKKLLEIKAKYDQLNKTIEMLQKKYDLCMLELPSTVSQFRLSYLMGADEITDQELKDLGVKIVDRTPDGDRLLKVSDKELAKYAELIKTKLANGFWNEIIGAKEIIFIFKFKDGSVKEYKLSPDNEQEIDRLCAEFNNESSDKTANVYKSISENKFYHDFMTEHYSDMINR